MYTSLLISAQRPKLPKLSCWPLLHLIKINVSRYINCEVILRWNGTLKYGDFHEKLNFLKIQDLRPLNNCQKHFEMILPNFSLEEC